MLGRPYNHNRSAVNNSHVEKLYTDYVLTLYIGRKGVYMVICTMIPLGNMHLAKRGNPADDD